jgi:hypothetical protein
MPGRALMIAWLVAVMACAIASIVMLRAIP